MFTPVGSATYDDFMGRFSRRLAPAFADWALHRVDATSALDVGCGTGALTDVLASRLPRVVAVDPSAEFTDVTQQRVPSADVRLGTAEALPLRTDEVDAALAQLVVHFMADPDAGIAELVRVTRPGGIVAACVWDAENDRAPHGPFLAAIRAVTGGLAPSLRAGTTRADLARRLRAAGCRDVEETELTVAVEYADLDEWWQIHRRGVGTTRALLDGLDTTAIARIRTAAATAFGAGPIRVSATAWAARGVV